MVDIYYNLITIRCLLHTVNFVRHLTDSRWATCQALYFQPINDELTLENQAHAYRRIKVYLT
jgi:hypothetical protein